jgi:hypothetical protein
MMNRSNNPHFTNIQESVRLTSPLGKKDAILVAKGSASYALYVVAAGQKLLGHHCILVFINCGSQTPTLFWLDESRLTCQNSYEAVANHSGTVTEEIPNGILVHTDHAI